MAEHSMQIESLTQAFDYCDEHGYRLVETYVDDKSGELMMKYDDGKNSISKSKRDIDREDEAEAAREAKILASTYGVATNYATTRAWQLFKNSVAQLVQQSKQLVPIWET